MNLQNCWSRFILFYSCSDEITVGYEFTVYMTSEGEGAVELCALITEPDSGGAPRVFSLLSSTRNSTASKFLDALQI